MLNSVPIEFRSSMQKKVSLLIMEAEQYPVVMTVRNMLYVLCMVESMGLSSHLPMILEVDNKGAVDMANS